MTLQEQIRHFKLLSFDFDGTIADTEVAHARAYSECLKPYGVDFGIVDMARYIGNTEDEIYTMLETDYHITIDRARFLSNRLRLFSLYAEYISPFSYFMDIARDNTLHSSTKIILSSQKDHMINYFLQKWCIGGIFHRILSAARENLPKTALLKKLPVLFNTQPDSIIVFEDSASTVTAAHEAGYSTAFVRHRLNYFQPVDADFVIDTLSWSK